MTRPPRILLGVTGSIAAYKAVELARLFIKSGAQVQVAMTRGAVRFVQPLTFQAITQQPVLVDVFEIDTRIEHVERAHDADLLIVAPTSANTIARLALGAADDPLTAIALSTTAPKVFAPAMESGMWTNAATRANVATLESRGWIRLGPEEGALASGRSGVGRLLEPNILHDRAWALLGKRDLEGQHVVVTAGPTWEAIDPVRLLTNRSTGAMGIAIANAAARRGARATIVLGPTHLSPDASVVVRRVESATDMLESARMITDADVLVSTAAVSDFRPAAPRDQKLKRSAAGADSISLVENPDVLATLSAEWRPQRPGLVVVGYAAETEDVVTNARGKLTKKGCDLVIGNLVGPGAGFGELDTSVVAVTAGGESPFGPASKIDVAEFVLDQVVGLGKQRRRP